MRGLRGAGGDWHEEQIWRGRFGVQCRQGGLTSRANGRRRIKSSVDLRRHKAEGIMRLLCRPKGNGKRAAGRAGRRAGREAEPSRKTGGGEEQ